MSDILNDLFIIPDFDNSKVVVTFTAPKGCSSVNWQIIDGGKVIIKGGQDLKAGELSKFEAKIKDFKPWNIDMPYLYQLKMSLTIDGKAAEIVENFGMRKIHATNDSIYVNNERFFARGFIRGREAHDHPNLENLPLEEYYAKNIMAAKKYGFNFIRFHSKVPPIECFRAADRLGIFIHIEIRKYFGKYQKERMYLKDDGEVIDKEEWTENILSLRNHPSLMVYCMGNEIRHPGHNPYVGEIYRLTKKLDSTRLFIDTCAHGEFDRDSVDIDVQHMSYFYPFGKDYDMFENTYNWMIFGSAKDVELVKQKQDGDFAGKISRTIPPRFPILAHEVCHYAALRDIYALDEKFKKIGAGKPWWIDELIKLIKLKGHEKNYKKMFETSKRFQFLGWKLGLEAARRSPLLCGFHFLQLSDTELYENSNGVINCFDDSTVVNEKEFLKFNSDTVVLADLPRRTYFENETVSVPVVLSHYSGKIKGDAVFVYSVSDQSGKVLISDTMTKINLDKTERREIATIQLKFPAVKEAKQLLFTLKLIPADGNPAIENSWDLWLYPNRPENIGEVACTVKLDEISMNIRYPSIKQKGSLEKPEKLLIVNRFSKEVINHLKNGGDAVVLYRVPQTRDRKVRTPIKEEYYLPATWDRFKGVIWDRGTNFGAFMRESKSLDGFPNDGFINLQFHGLINDCDKIILDDFPCPVEPIIEGVDKASRDRFDVYTYKLSELQPDRTMRKFGYMFELKVGKGRLFVTGFNFTGLNSNKPECCAMFESIIKYVISDAFKPAVSIDADKLEEYLLKKAMEPILKERKMTQYWQLDENPLEGDKYWTEAEEYLAENR